MEDNDIFKGLERLCLSSTGRRPISIEPMAQSGSDRRYFRIYVENGSFIGTYVPDPSEGRCFVALAADFRMSRSFVPEVLGVAANGALYIQEDLGDRSLFSILAKPQARALIKETLLRLVDLQQAPESLWIEDCMSAPFSKRQIMWDLNYFKYDFLKPHEIAFDEELLEDDFERLSRRLVSIPDELCGFMMRDCQSRNVMITDRGPVFIDFQGGRRGPVLYDAVSLLWQARAGFDRDFKVEMLDFYCEAFCKGDESKKASMLSWCGDFVLFRTLQVLGAYGFRGLVQNKAHFLLSIPGGLANLSELLHNGSLDRYPELKKCAVSLTSVVDGRENAVSDGLTIEIYSFSYKKGYPRDLSGNGGGFMFDCRALHNPGRYEIYRSMTGLDQPVINFLEERGEVQSFLKNAWALTDPAIERYLSRGFTRLQIGFGCTGGRHRSVYCAQHTADHIRDLFPEINVNLIHREQSGK